MDLNKFIISVGNLILYDNFDFDCGLFNVPMIFLGIAIGKPCAYGFQSVFKPIFLTFSGLEKTRCFNINYTWQHKFIFTGNTKCWKLILSLYYIYKQQKSFVFCFCKWERKLVVMLLLALFFGIFCFRVCKFFYFLIRSEGADNATFIWCICV
jgi:hypothetical protein